MSTALTAGRVRLLLIWSLFLALPFWLHASGVATAAYVLISAIGAVGINIVIGYAGQISLGHAFFLATGAYTYAVLADGSSNSVIWLPVAAIVAAALGAAIGPIALRLHGLYLAVVTLGLVFIGQHILFNSAKLSGGPEGRVFAPLAIGGFDFSTDLLNVGPFTIDANGLYYYLAGILLAFATWFAHNLRHSRTGRAMLALKNGPKVAALGGIAVARTKILAFALSAFFGGLCGALYAAYIGYAQPGYWNLHLSIAFVGAVIIGGMGSTWGPLLGSLVVFALPAVLQDVTNHLGEGISAISTGTIAAIIYGGLLVGFLVVEPLGLVGIGRRLWARARPTPPGPDITPMSPVGATPALAIEKEHE
jgi:branched-chain amino acid transport system permease protein